MPSDALSLSIADARRLQRRAVLLETPLGSVDAVLAHLGYVQIDPINVCGRMQDHILRPRVADYREGDLTRHLHGDDTRHAPAARSAFEHHLPDTHVLVAFPQDAWPHLLAAMRRRTRHRGPWSGRLTSQERALSDTILAELSQRGPLSSADIEDERRSRQRVWGTASLAKSTLQKLFFHGRVLIAGRQNNRRLYDLPERVLPPEVLSRPEPSASDTRRWLAHLKLRQRRLGTLRREELSAIDDLVQAIQVDGCPTLYCLKEDVPRLDTATTEVDDAPPRLLAPLDPLIYDRRVTSTLWDFDYTWEVYTPPAKRRRGYYALPVLHGLRLVGHVDPKADRAAGRLRIISRRVSRGSAVAPAVRALASFLGLRHR